MLKKFPVIRLTILFALGILFQRTLGIQLIPLICLTGASVLLSSVSKFLPPALKNPLQSGGIALGLIGAGAILYAINNPKLTELPFRESSIRRLTVAGKIASIDLKRENRITFYLESGALIKGDTAIRTPYTFLCSYKDTVQHRLDSLYKFLKPGYIVSFPCSYSPGKGIRNPGEFDYASYLHEKGIAGILSLHPDSAVTYQAGGEDVFAVWLLAVRNSIGDRIAELFDSNAGGLARGLLLGDKNEISEDVQEQFVNAGVAHVLAVSGLNVAFVSVIIFFLLGRFSLKTRYIASALGITLFWLIAGNSPSVARAAIMGYIVIINYFMGRDTSGMNTLFLTAFLILIAAPYDLFSPSFQLSFGGILAILLVYPPLRKLVAGLPFKSRFLKQILLLFALTFAAQLGVLPITDYYFGKVSLTSFVTNIIVVPLTNMVMGAQIMSLIVSAVWFPVGQIQAVGCNVLTALLYYFVRIGGDPAYSFIPLSNFNNGAVLGYYILFGIFLSAFQSFGSVRARFALIVSVVLCLSTYHAVVNKPVLVPGKLNILAVDIGQGDATLIQTPDGTTILSDAGNATAAFDNGKRVILPLLEHLHITAIDYAIISHLDADHYKGIFALLKAGKIKTLVKPPAFKLAEDSTLTQFAHLTGTDIIIPRDSAWHIGGCALYFLANEQAWHTTEFSQNDMSLCFTLHYGETSMLFLGDAQAGRERQLEQEYGPLVKASLLKVAHHGSKHGTTREFIDLVSPRYALISVGERNVYHHPHGDVLERLRQAHVNVSRTDFEGAILYTSDGHTVEKISWR